MTRFEGAFLLCIIDNVTKALTVPLYLSPILAKMLPCHQYMWYAYSISTLPQVWLPYLHEVGLTSLLGLGFVISP